MNKYLVKIASTQEKKKPDLNTPGHRVAGGVAGAYLAHVLGAPATRLGQVPIRSHEDHPNFMPEHNYEAAKTHVALRTNSAFTRHEAGLPPGAFSEHGPAYFHADHVNPMLKAHGHDIHMHKNYIQENSFASGMKDSKMIGLHEMGHAVDINHRKPSSHLLAYSRKYGRGFIPGAAAAGLLANDKTRDYAPLAPLVAHAPELFVESKANHEAHKLVKNFGGNTGHFKKFVGKQMLGYAARPLAMAGVLAAAAHGLRKREKK